MLLLSWKLTLIFIVITGVYIVASRVFLPRIRTCRARCATERRVQRATYRGRLLHRAGQGVRARSVGSSNGSARRRPGSMARKCGPPYWADLLRHPAIDRGLSRARRDPRLSVPLLVGGGLSIGTLVAFWTYWTIIQGPIGALFTSMSTLFNGFAAMDRILEFLEKQPMPRDQLHAPAATVKGARSSSVRSRSAIRRSRPSRCSTKSASACQRIPRLASSARAAPARAR